MARDREGRREALLAIVICFIMKNISRIGEKKASWCWLNCDVIKKFNEEKLCEGVRELGLKIYLFTF